MRNHWMFINQKAAVWLVVASVALSVPLSARPAFATTASQILSGGRTYAMEAVAKAEEYWNSAIEGLKAWIPGVTSPADLMNGMAMDQKPSPTDFSYMMDVAGYSVSEVKVSVGLVPETSFKFRQTREISRYDREYLQRLLRKQRRERPGLQARAERVIIETVMEFYSFKNFDLTTIDMWLRPLPSVEFTVEPKGVVFDQKTSKILGRIDKLNEKLAAIAKH